MNDRPTPDPLDRLRAFDAAQPPDQWDDIVRRAETGADVTPLHALDAVSGRNPNRARWVLAAAAAALVVVGGIAIVASDDDGEIAPATLPSTVPTTAPSTTVPSSTVPGPAPTTAVPSSTSPADPGAAFDCANLADLDAAVAAGTAGYPMVIAGPAADATALLSRTRSIVVARVASIEAVANDAGRTLTLRLTDPEMIAGQSATPVTRVSVGQWLFAGAGRDPFVNPVALDGISVVAFGSAFSDELVADVEGIYLGCDTGPAISLGQQAGFVPAGATLADVEQLARAAQVALLPCTELGPSNGAPSPLDPALDALGPLATDPVFDIRLTDLQATGAPPGANVVAQVDRIAGGILVFVRPDFESGLSGWQLAAVDDTGIVLWQVCGTDVAQTMIVGPPDADRRVVDVQGSQGWHSYRTVDGSTTGVTPLDIPFSAGIAARDDRYLLVAPDGPAATQDGGRLQLVDLVDGAVTDVPAPPGAGEVTTYALHRRDDGSPVIEMSDNIGYQPALAVFVDGQWHTDRDTLMGELDIRVIETFEGDGRDLGPGVLAVDPLGATVWFHETAGALPGEGFHTGVFGDVAVANVCRVPVTADDANCSGGAFIGLDLLTGEVLWERDGFDSVLGWSDRYVFTGSNVLDVRTGEDLQTSPLPADTFFQGCCGEDTYLYTRNDGGVVWAVNYGSIKVFYPEGAATPTAEVDLRQQ